MASIRSLELIAMSNAAVVRNVYARRHRPVNRLGYGAMQLTGPGVFGPPKDKRQPSPYFGNP
jgi:hypothetical protein